MSLGAGHLGEKVLIRLKANRIERWSIQVADSTRSFPGPRPTGKWRGATRTYEINRRLGTRHDITVLTAAFPGSRPTRKYNADYIPIGVDAGYYGRMLSYLLALPLAVRALDFDLLVEDFAPPFATCFCPTFTSRPVVASVQWLLRSRDGGEVWSALSANRETSDAPVPELCGLDR